MNRTSLVVLASLTCASLSGCTTLQGFANQALDISNPAAGIAIRSEVDTSNFVYVGGQECSYAVRGVENGRTVRTSSLTIRLSNVRNRILATHTKPEGVATALISNKGELLDFNVPSGRGTRVTPDSSSTSAFWLDAPTYLHPNYGSGRATPDTFYGKIQGPDKQRVARLLYRGHTTFSQNEALVFDIMNMNVSSTFPNGVPIGRIITDPRNGLPFVLVGGAGNRIQYERTSCSRA